MDWILPDHQEPGHSATPTELEARILTSRADLQRTATTDVLTIEFCFKQFWSCRSTQESQQHIDTSVCNATATLPQRQSVANENQMNRRFILTFSLVS